MSIRSACAIPWLISTCPLTSWERVGDKKIVVNSSVENKEINQANQLVGLGVVNRYLFIYIFFYLFTYIYLFIFFCLINCFAQA